MYVLLRTQISFDFDGSLKGCYQKLYGVSENIDDLKEIMSRHTPVTSENGSELDGVVYRGWYVVYGEYDTVKVEWTISDSNCREPMTIATTGTDEYIRLDKYDEMFRQQNRRRKYQKKMKEMNHH